MSRNRRLTRDENATEMNPFYDEGVSSAVTYTSKDHPRCTMKKISALVICCVLLVMFWIELILFAYFALHREDFVSLKPLKLEQYPPNSPFPSIGRDSSFLEPKFKKECVHVEYLTDFGSEDIFRNIWILLVFCIIGILVSTSALYGILMKSPYYLDFLAFFLFLYGVHKLGVAVILFLIKCFGIFLLKYAILIDPSMILLSFVDKEIPILSIHLIFAVVAFCALMCLTRFRDHMVKKKLKNEKMARELKVFAISSLSTSV